MRHHRDNLRQRELEFPTRRGDQLRWLRDSRVGDSYSKLLLHKLDDHLGERNKTWKMTIPELAAEMECSEYTVLRRMRSLAERDLLIIERIDDESQFYEFQIVWSNLADLVPTEPKTRKPTRRGRPRKPREFPLSAENFEQGAENFELTAGNFEQRGFCTSYIAPLEAPTESATVKKFRAEDYPIPPELDTPDFRVAWIAFCEYRRSHKRHPEVSEAAAKQLMKGLIPFGPRMAVEKIEAAIANDWRGVVFPNGSKGTPAHERQSAQRRKYEQAVDALDEAFGHDAQRGP